MIAGIVTAVLLAGFVGIVVWAWSGRNRARFAAAAQLPLVDEPACCCGHGACRESSR